MPDAIAAIPAMTWIVSGLAYFVLIVLVVVCVLAISVTHNRFEEMRFVEQKQQANSVEIAKLVGIADDPKIANAHPKLAQELGALLNEAAQHKQTVTDLTYKRLYGDKDARNNGKRWADRFHANSDTTNVMIIGTCACSIAVCAAKLLAAARGQPKPGFPELFSSVTVLDIFLGMLTGLLATFVMKSGSTILSKTSLASIDVSNPYGVAFVAAVAGLFMDKFYSWFEPLLAIAK